MDVYDAKDFGKLLKRNALQARRLLLPSHTDVMRVYDRNLDAFPLTIDVYGRYAYIVDYSDKEMDEQLRMRICDIVSRMLYIALDHIVFHERKKRQGKEQHGLQSDASLKVTVHENGLAFLVDLTRRIDTGLFLDQIVARQMVRDMSAGLKVLNLFSYTGAFSVYAAAGGAKRVVSVDLSATYTNWCKENLATNGFFGEAYPCICMDAASYMKDAIQKGMEFDLVILDPPSFSNSRKTERDFDVQRDYITYIRLVNNLLPIHGKLLFSTNLKTFWFEEKNIYGFTVRQISREIAAPGFSGKKNALRSWILEKEREWKTPPVQRKYTGTPPKERKQSRDSLHLNWDERTDALFQKKKEYKTTDAQRQKPRERDYQVYQPREKQREEREERERHVAEDRQRRPESIKKGAPKPYGYDRFKPTRSRGEEEESLRRDEKKRER